MASAASASAAILFSQSVFAQYDDSLSGKISSIACSRGAGNMSSTIVLLLNPLSYTGENQASDFYKIGLSLADYIESSTKQQTDSLIIDIMDKTTKSCPNNFGQSEYDGVRKQVDCYRKTGSAYC